MRRYDGEFTAALRWSAGLRGAVRACVHAFAGEGGGIMGGGGEGLE